MTVFWFDVIGYGMVLYALPPISDSKFWLGLIVRHVAPYLKET